MIKAVHITQKVLKAHITSGARKTIVSVKSNNRVKAAMIGIRGLPGADGASTTSVSKTAFQNLGGQRLVIAKNATQVDYADNQTPGHANLIFGITENAAVADAPISIKMFGETTESSWNWTIGQPIFCGTNGLMTQTVPQTGFLIIVATAISPDTIFINIRQPILL